jgi:hypothetical protein
MVTIPLILSPVYEFPNFYVQATNPVAKEAIGGDSLPAGTVNIGVTLENFVDLFLLKLVDIELMDNNHSSYCNFFALGTLRFLDFGI